MDIYMPPKKIIQPHAEMAVGMKGEFRCIVRDGKTMQPVSDSGWDKNIITNNGLRHLVSGSVGNNCCVGSGSTPATVTDEGVEVLLAWFNTALVESYVQPTAGNNWTGSQTKGYRFNAGSINGTVREIAVFQKGTADDTNTDCTSRVVLSTPVVVQPTQVFDIWWKLTCVLPQGDVVNQIDIPEDGSSVLYDTVTRGAYTKTTTNFRTMSGHIPYNLSSWYLHTGPISTFDGTGPTGSSISGYSRLESSGWISAPVQTSNYAYHDYQLTWDLDNGMAVKSASMLSYILRYWQTEYTDVATAGATPIPYDNTNTLRLEYRFTVTRV